MSKSERQSMNNLPLAGHSKRPAESATRLGRMLTELMENMIAPQQERFQCLSELWRQVLPAELYEHCRVDSISAGQLKVLVDSPSHMYQLQLCSSDILAELKRRCPQYRIKGIKLVIC